MIRILTAIAITALIGGCATQPTMSHRGASPEVLAAAKRVAATQPRTSYVPVRRPAPRNDGLADALIYTGAAMLAPAYRPRSPTTITGGYFERDGRYVQHTYYMY